LDATEYTIDYIANTIEINEYKKEIKIIKSIDKMKNEVKDYYKENTMKTLKGYHSNK